MNSRTSAFYPRSRPMPAFGPLCRRESGTKNAPEKVNEQQKKSGFKINIYRQATKNTRKGGTKRHYHHFQLVLGLFERVKIGNSLFHLDFSSFPSLLLDFDHNGSSHLNRIWSSLELFPVFLALAMLYRKEQKKLQRVQKRYCLGRQR